MALDLDSHYYQSFSSATNTVSSIGWGKLHSIGSAKRTERKPVTFTPSTWVKLFKPPTAFSFDEAWLLCECGENQWLAWVPDYGEIVLSTDEFCSPAEDC